MKRLFLLGALVVVTSLAASAAAPASVRLYVAPDFSVLPTVGDRNDPAALKIVNASTGNEAAGTVSLTDIEFVPFCGWLLDGGNCPASFRDPGTMTVTGAANGRAGTACAGVSFGVQVDDVQTGRVALTPGSTVVLGAPGSLDDTCVIDLGIDVNREPTTYAPEAFGGIASSGALVIGQVTGGTEIGDGEGDISMRIHRATLSITATAQTTAPAPAELDDTVVIGGPSTTAPPTGVLNWTVYGPGDPSCTSGAHDHSMPITGDGTYHLTTHAPEPGTYRWVVRYDGDRTYQPVTSACNDPGQTSVVVGPLFIQSSLEADWAGEGIADEVELYGDNDATGSVAFALYGPDDPSCAQAPIFTSTVAVPGRLSPAVQSDFFAAPDPGTYHWTASYSGDALNAPRTILCTDPKTADVVPVAPRLRFGPMTVVLPPGAQQSAAVVLSGMVHPTGTLSFALYGPWDRTCSRPPIFTSTVPVSGNGNFTSSPATAVLSGVYDWIATYSGDASQGPITSRCEAQGSSFDAFSTSDFTITASHVARDHAITITIDGHSQGRLSAFATFVETIKRTSGNGRLRHMVVRHRTVVYGKASTDVAGRLGVLTLKPTAAARAVLKRIGRLSVKATLTFAGRQAPRTTRHAASVAVRR